MSENSETNERVDAKVYRRRRIGVLVGSLVAIVVAVAVVIAVAADDDAPERFGTMAPSTTTTVPPTTTTTVPPTTTTTSTTTTTVAPTTTEPPPTTAAPTTLPPPTTVVFNGVPVWPPYDVEPALDGVAALTGLPTDQATAARPILAVKIDNHPRGRPQWGLDVADAIIEENVEGVTRFIGLFHSNLPGRAGPVRSARTGDLDLFAAMNRPVLAWSGGNPGVTTWINAAAQARLLVDFTAQTNPCYERNSSRSAPHNLLIDPLCAVNTAFEPGPAQPLWDIDGAWKPGPGVATRPDSSFDVPMDGVRVTWNWDGALKVYVRSQNGQRHIATSGNPIVMNNVVELYTAHPPSPVDARSPNPVTVGGGRAVVHRDGVAIEARWSRPTAYDAFEFTDVETGKPVPLDQGRTFLELARG